jgi:hypothetical protein
VRALSSRRIKLAKANQGRCKKSVLLFRGEGILLGDRSEFVRTAPTPCILSAVRPFRLEIFDHSFVCPYCRTAIVFASIHRVIPSSRRNCPACSQAIQIENGKVFAIKPLSPTARKKQKIVQK